jgi:replicative DNA helicase Mcm
MTTAPYQNVPNKAERIASYYEQHGEAQLEQVTRGERDTIEIDCTELHEFDPALFDSLCSEGSYRDVVERFQRAAVKYSVDDRLTKAFSDEEAPNLILDSIGSDDDQEESDGEDEEELRLDVPNDVDVALVNFPPEARIEIGEPRTEDFGRLIAIRGVVRQVSSPRTLVKYAVWECQRCGTFHTVPVEHETIQKPSECEACGRTVPWARNTSNEQRVDYQEIHLQEEPGEAVDQSNPRTMTIRIEGTELIDATRPGERVEVRGVMEEDLSDEKAVIIDGYVSAADIDTESEDYESLEIDEEEATQFEAMSDRVNVEQLCVDSLAPDVYGEEMPKRAIVYQLFGGVSHFVDSSERDTKAGEIHLAFIGDPGTVKSTLASAARRVSPRSVKAVGKGMTAAGMTASAIQKEIAGSQEWTLQAGALVLADKGVITIDELDKANEEVQKSLHEALSDQEVSVSKASINVSLPTRVSALMIANPKHGRFDEFEPVAEQFNLDSALLDRADMVLSFVDEPDQELDRKIARQNLSYGMAGDGSEDVPDDVGALDLTADGLLTTESFRRYVAYAKREYEPTMTAEARDTLEDFYATIRALSSEGDVSLSARAIDSLRKFAEARARMQLRDEITLEDAESVVEMYMEMYKDMGVDPDSGQFSASVADGTRGASKRENTKDAIRTAINELSDFSTGDLATREEVIEAVDSEEDVDSVIDKLLNNGSLYQPETDTLGIND